MATLIFVCIFGGLGIILLILFAWFGIYFIRKSDEQGETSDILDILNQKILPKLESMDKKLESIDNKHTQHIREEHLKAK